RRHDEHRRPRGRIDYRGDVPEGVRRRTALGAPRHRGDGLGGRSEAVPAERAKRSRGPDPGRPRVREVLIQNKPLIVKIISPPKDETGLSQLADVLIGSV